MMCSEIINIANSCYLDNWENVFRVVSYAVAMSVYLVALVGIIIVSLRK